MKFKILYLISKIYGLSPFRYDWMSATASPSPSSTIYCIVHGTFFSILAASCEYFIFLTTPYENLKFVGHVVGHIEVISTTMKFVSIIFLQIIYRMQLILIVNKVVVLNKKIDELCSGDDKIYNKGLYNTIEVKLYLSVVGICVLHI